MKAMRFPLRAKLLATAMIVLMTAVSSLAVLETNSPRLTLGGRTIVLPDGRSGRILYLVNGKAGVGVQVEGRSAIAELPWSEAAGLARGGNLNQAAESQSE